MELITLPNGSYQCPDDPGEPVYNAPRVSITDEEGRILQEYANGRRVLEIGTGLGVSTHHLRTAAELWTTDIDAWVKENVWPGLRELGVNCVERDEIVGQFDLIFIDGCHTPEWVQQDWKLACTVGRLYAQVIFHDADIIPIRKLTGRQPQIIPTQHGLGILEVDHASLRLFVPGQIAPTDADHGSVP